MEAMQWYKSLSIDQKMFLKEEAKNICGMKWEDFTLLFTPRERIKIIYDKLINETLTNN